MPTRLGYQHTRAESSVARREEGAFLSLRKELRANHRGTGLEAERRCRPPRSLYRPRGIEVLNFLDFLFGTKSERKTTSTASTLRFSFSRSSGICASQRRAMYGR